MSSVKPNPDAGAVGKVPSKKPAKKKAPPGDVIPNPINYLDVLASSEEVGNTPRPSKARTHFYTGMRSLNSNIVNAEKNLLVAVQEAMKTMKDQKKVPKVDVERLAYTYMGLGYCHVWSGKIALAVPCYLKSATMWSKLHKKDPSLLIPLFCDASILLILTNNSDQKKWIAKCITLFDQSVKSSVGSPRNAIAIARLASVASGQKGKEMHIPLKENAKKLVLPDKLVRILYQKSIGFLNRKLSEKEKDKNYLIILMLFRDFLQNTKESTTTKKIAPVTSEKDSNTKVVATSTAISTSTAPVTSGKVSDSGTKKSSENKDLQSIEILKITEQIENLQVKLGVNPTT